MWRKQNKDKKRITDTAWRKANRVKCLEANRRYRERHKEKIKKKYQTKKHTHQKKKREYYLKNREHFLLKAKLYQKATREARNKRQQERMRNDPKFRIACTMSKALFNSLKSKKGGKKWEGLVGFTVHDLMRHLESQFTNGMTWKNYGTYWHIDHLVPQYYFDFDSYDHPHFKACWSLKNLQPLEVSKNLRKNKHIIQI